MKKRLTALFLAFALISALLPAAVLTASAETYSGTCGANLTWTLDTETGVLEIAGTGEMDIWWGWDEIPWDSYRNSIKTVNIGNGVTSIGNQAFEACKGLTSVTIPASVTSIGYYAFRECDALTSVTIPASVASIGDWAFEYCSRLTSITVDAGNADYCSMDGVLYNKDKTVLVCYPAGKIESSFTIPDNVTSIGNSAFSGCEQLESLTIPTSVTSIGEGAFTYCTELTSIAVAAGNADYCSMDGVLYNKDKTVLVCYPAGKSESSYTFPDGVTRIGDWAFYECYSLTSITIPDSVTSIGDYAFCDCSGLTSVTIGNGVTSIGERAFYECYSLTSITIPDSVTSIGESAFEYTGYYNNESNWTNGILYIGNYLIKAKETLTGAYTVKEGTTLIADDAFLYCDGLTSVKIPDSVTSIGDWAFYECYNLTSITIPDSVTSIGDYAFCDCTGLTSVTIGSGVMSIGEGAFAYCSGLTSITIPSSVTSIGEGAFYYCTELTEITIPGGVTSIGDLAFGYYYDGLSDIRIDSFTIYGYNNSAAQAYAEENGFTFIALGDTPPEVKVAGDLNGDGGVDAVDSIRLAKYLVGLVELTDAQIATADINGDGDVTATDAIRLARYLVGLVDTLRPEPV